MRVYLRTKFQVSSLIQRGLDREKVILLLSPLKMNL